jgi:hypothetical protein
MSERRERTQAQVVTEIHREREELVSAVADVRRDMTRELTNLRGRIKQQLPKVAAGVAIAVGALTALRVVRGRRTSPETSVWLRVGRFALIDYR